MSKLSRKSHAELRFGVIRQTVKDDTAAALIVLAEAIAEPRVIPAGEIGHEICLGIRKGLFGANASDYSTILNIVLGD